MAEECTPADTRPTTENQDPEETPEETSKDEAADVTEGDQSGNQCGDDRDQEEEEEELPFPGFVPVVFKCMDQRHAVRFWCLRTITWPYPFNSMNSKVNVRCAIFG